MAIKIEHKMQICFNKTYQLNIVLKINLFLPRHVNLPFKM